MDSVGTPGGGASGRAGRIGRLLARAGAWRQGGRRRLRQRALDLEAATGDVAAAAVELRWSGRPPSLRHRFENGVLWIVSRCPEPRRRTDRCRVHGRISVPDGARVRANVDAGTITAEDLNSPSFEASSGAGNLSASFLRPPSSVEMTTNTGILDLAEPPSARSTSPPADWSAELDGADLPGVEVEVEGAAGGGEGGTCTAEEVAGAGTGEPAADGRGAGVGVLADDAQLEPAAAAPQRREDGPAVPGDLQAGDRLQRPFRTA